MQYSQFAIAIQPFSIFHWKARVINVQGSVVEDSRKMAVVPLSPGFFQGRNDLIIYYSMMGLSTGIIHRLLQRHGYLISKDTFAA